MEEIRNGLLDLREAAVGILSIIDELIKRADEQGEAVLAENNSSEATTPEQSGEDTSNTDADAQA